MVYFFAYARAEIPYFKEKKSRELGVGCESLPHTQILNSNLRKRLHFIEVEVYLWQGYPESFMQDVLALTLIGSPGTANTHAPPTTHGRNLKRVLITLETHEMFSVHASLDKFENATLSLCLRES